MNPKDIATHRIRVESTKWQTDKDYAQFRIRYDTSASSTVSAEQAVTAATLLAALPTGRYGEVDVVIRVSQTYPFEAPLFLFPSHVTHPNIHNGRACKHFMALNHMPQLTVAQHLVSLQAQLNDDPATWTACRHPVPGGDHRDQRSALQALPQQRPPLVACYHPGVPVASHRRIPEQQLKRKGPDTANSPKKKQRAESDADACEWHM